MTSVQGITFEARPSASLSVLLLGIVLAGVIAPWPTDLPLAARLFLSGSALGFGLWRVHRQRHPPVTAVQWSGEGAWLVVDTSGKLHAAEPRGARVVGEWVCLRLFWAGGSANLVLGPDNMDPELLRTLRIRLSSL